MQQALAAPRHVIETNEARLVERLEQAVARRPELRPLLDEARAQRRLTDEQLLSRVRDELADESGTLRRNPAVRAITRETSNVYAVDVRLWNSAVARYVHGQHDVRLLVRIHGGGVTDPDELVQVWQVGDDTDVIFLLNDRADPDAVAQRFTEVFGSYVDWVRHARTRFATTGRYAAESAAEQAAAYGGALAGIPFGHGGFSNPAGVALWRGSKVVSDAAWQPWNDADRARVDAVGMLMQSRYTWIPSHNRIMFTAEQLHQLRERQTAFDALVARVEAVARPAG
jgi:hypothetical protein